ncbi:MAG: AEC family transporter, partial [Desulfobacterales bacterium]|nr:AEC family transporter [Desulfobacterales bacterium]
MRRSGFLPGETWPGMEKLTYFILFPALLIRTLGNRTLMGSPWPSMLAVVAGVLMISSLALIAWRRIRSPVDNALFTSVFQGGVRINTYIALAVAQGFWGPEGLALGSVAVGFTIVLINLLCISAFAAWGKTSIRGWAPFLREVVGNPLIVGCAIGWFLSLSGIGLPGVMEDIFEILGRAALPLGLLAVGAALKPGKIRGHAMPVAISSLVQFGVKPLTAALLIYWTGLTGVAAGVLLAAFM